LPDPARLSANVDLAAGLEDLPAPAYVVDRKGVIAWVNAAAVKLLGDRVGQSYATLVAPEHRDLTRAKFVAKVVGETSTVYDVVVLDRNGRRQTMRVNSTPLRSGNAVVGVLGVAVPLGSGASGSSEAPPELTPRQHETLRLLGDGLTTAQVAERLGVAEETARNHIRAVLRALDAHSRLEAVVRGVRTGLLGPADLTHPGHEFPGSSGDDSGGEATSPR
jgi:PAS domain S-box-containing protein